MNAPDPGLRGGNSPQRVASTPLPREIPIPRFAQATMPRRAERHPTLLWVHSGTARLTTAHGTRLLSAGGAVWVPAGLAYELRVEPDTVVIPVVEPHPVSAISALAQLEIDDAQGDWLIWRFARSLGFLASPDDGEAALDVVTGCRTDGTVPGAAPPPLPRSSAALQIARTVLRDPAAEASLSGLAAAHAISERSLQAHFRAETGLPFGRWRTAVRVAAAAELLLRGHDVGWAAQHVGFRTPSGFSRAFVARTGHSPGAFARQHDATRRAPHVQSPLAPTRTPGAEPRLQMHPRIPRSVSWERINDFHVLVWVYRGSARVTIGDTRVDLHRGDALWLPPGKRNRVELEPGAILLPLGSVPARSGTTTPQLRAIRLPEAAETFLLHSCVANYSWIRPRGHDAFRITRWFLSSCASLHDPAPSSPSAAASALASAVRARPEAAITLRQWCAAHPAPRAQLAREFRRAYGQSFATWRHRLRMTLARQYLTEGMSVRAVAARVGYAHPPAFSRAFAKAHGISPKQYRAEASAATAELIVG